MTQTPPTQVSLAFLHVVPSTGSQVTSGFFGPTHLPLRQTSGAVPSPVASAGTPDRPPSAAHRAGAGGVPRAGLSGLSGFEPPPPTSGGSWRLAQPTAQARRRGVTNRGGWRTVGATWGEEPAEA